MQAWYQTTKNQLSTGLNRFIAGRFERFLTKRMPGKSKQTLTRNNLFIVPSKFGFAYLFTLSMLFVLGTNYHNNIILLLSYLLLSIFLSALLSCFNNLAGLQLSFTKELSGYQHQEMLAHIHIDAPAAKYQLELTFPEQKPYLIQRLSQGGNDIYLPLYFTKRGQYQLSRLKVATQYALGLFTCWTQLDFAKQVTVYPQAKKISPRYVATSIKHLAGRELVKGFDDFYQLSTFQQGESLAHVSWKQLAKGQGLLSKQYQSTASKGLAVVLADMPSSNIELKLQYCCYLLLDAWQKNQPISLDLGSVVISPPTDSEQGASDLANHFHHCLTALALYQAKAS